MKKLGIVILAAGFGKRMQSGVPKVLHKIAGKPIISFITDKVEKLKPDKKVIVLGHGKELVRKVIPSGLEIVTQKKMLGTGDAVKQCIKKFCGFKGNVIVLCGDVPLIEIKTLKNLINMHNRTKSVISLITTELENPTGYGRIVKNNKNEIVSIIEEKDADKEQKNIKEINSGIYCFDSEFLFQKIKTLKSTNKQKEYYLTDIISIAFRQKQKIKSLLIKDSIQLQGINTRRHLEFLTRKYYYLKNIEFMQKGITIDNTDNVCIGPDVIIEKDCTILPYTYLSGKTRVKKNSIIGPHTYLNNVNTGSNVKITYSSFENETVRNNTVILNNNIQ